MSIYIYQLSTGGNWILNESKDSNPVSSFSKKIVRNLVEGVWQISILSAIDDSVTIPTTPLNNFLKENGQPYRSIEEFERFTADLFSEFTSNSGPAGIIDVTYDELATLIGSSLLVANQDYKITDFATTHFLMFDDIKLDVTPIVGVTEPLIVTATSTTSLGKEAKSLIHPEDKIYYDWDPANWVRDAAFADELGIITGFKGVIYFRHDTLRDNYTGYDFRNVRFRRFKSNIPAWSDATTYASGARIQDAAGMYVSLKGSNLNNLVTDTTYWAKVLDYSVSDYVTGDPTDTLLMVLGDPGAHDDFLTFAELVTSDTYDNAVRSNHLETFKDDSLRYCATMSILTNNVFFIPQATDPVSFSVYSNKFDSACAHNTFLGIASGNQFYFGCNRNCISTGFVNNVINASVYNCLLGPNFFGNVLELSCSNMFVGDSCFGNIFGSFAVNVTLGSNSINNVIGSYLMNCVLPDSFQMNIIDPNFNFNWLDLSGATHIKAAYNCRLTTASGGALKLKYIDELGAEQIVAANA